MNLYQSRIYIDDLETAIEMIVGVERLFNKSVLITGASGLIGSFLVDTLLMCNRKHHAEITIYAVSRNSEQLKKRFNTYNDYHIVFLNHDVNNAVDFDIKPDFVIYAAGNSYPKLFMEAPTETLLNSVIGTKNYLEFACKQKTSRFLFVSSGEVYGQYDGVTQAYDEKYSGYIDTMNPRSCYPIGKRAAESLCVSFSKQYGISTVIARLCHTYGANITPNDNRANAQFLINAAMGHDIVMNSSGSQLRSYCYLADSISAILSVLINGENIQAYNIANPDSVITIADFAKIAAECSNCKVVFRNPDDKQIAQLSPLSRQVLKTEKLMKLGWIGRFDARKGIEHTINIMKESGL